MGQRWPSAFPGRIVRFDGSMPRVVQALMAMTFERAALALCAHWTGSKNRMVVGACLPARTAVATAPNG